MKIESKGISGASGMFGQQASRSLGGLGGGMSNMGGAKGGQMSFGPSMGSAKPTRSAVDGAQMTGTTAQTTESLDMKRSTLAVLKAPAVVETAKRRKPGEEVGQGMRDAEEISSILVTRVFEVNLEKKYIVVGRNKLLQQPLKDKARIPADDYMCQLFFDRLKTGKTEITVTPTGRDAEGRREFECYPRHFNMSAQGTSSQSIGTL